MDIDGLLTSGIGLSLIVFGLIEGTRLGWLTPTTDFTLGPFAWPASAPVSLAAVAIGVGLVFLVLFIVWERHRARNGRDAMLDLHLFTMPTFTWGNLTALAVAAGEFALVFLLPLYLVNALGLSVLGAGLVLAAMAVGAFISGAQARQLAARFSAPTVVVAGLVLEVAGVFITMAVLGENTAAWLVALTMVI